MEHASNKEIYSVQATVRTYESGANGLMKPETVLHWFQEIAEAHASCLGFGYDFVTSRSLAWVEVRMDAAVSRLPRWKETVELRTWTAQETPLLARRNLEIRDAQGNCIVAASCLWAVIDIRRRRPVPLNRHISSFPDTPCKETVAPVSMDISGLLPMIREWTAERPGYGFQPPHQQCRLSGLGSGLPSGLLAKEPPTDGNSPAFQKRNPCGRFHEIPAVLQGLPHLPPPHARR